MKTPDWKKTHSLNQSTVSDFFYEEPFVKK